MKCLEMFIPRAYPSPAERKHSDYVELECSLKFNMN